MAGELERPYGGTRVRPEADDDVLASEVAAYSYCAKAWHLEYVLGCRADAAVEKRREVGTAEHDAHGTRVRRLQRIGQPLMRTAVFLLVLAGVLMITAMMIGRG